jgi:drug/metabolite transporter (DMT)-like permease
MKERFANSEVFALLSAALWGINYPNTKLILTRLSVPEMLLARFPAAAALMMVYMILCGEGLYVRIIDLPRILVLGFICVGVYNVIWTNAIRLTSAANAALLISCAPIFTTIYTAVRGEEVITARRWCGVLLAFAGILLITLFTSGARLRLDSDAFIGNLLCLVASFIFSAYNLLAKPLLKRYSPVKLTSLVTALGLLFIVPYGVWNLDLSHLTNAFRDGAPALQIEILYLILLGTVVAYICWYRGIQGAGPARTVLYHYLVSVISMIVGFFLLMESPSAGQLIGAGLVLGGLLISRNLPQSHAEFIQNKP